MAVPTNDPHITEIAVSGTPEQLGEAHGEQLRPLIGDVYAWRMTEITDATGEAEDAVLDRAASYLAPVEALAADIVREVRGIGRGSRLGFRRAFFLQVATEVSLEPAAGCSAIGIADGSRGPVVAQNWDQPEASAGKQVVLRLRPTGKPEILMFGHAGVVGYIGLNANGLGHVGNQLYLSTTMTAGGLTQYVINRRLLEFASVEAALEWLTSIPVASTCNYLIGDASGALVDVELGGGRATIQARGRSLAHTNHYLIEPFRTADRASEVLPDSQHRLATLQAGPAAVDVLRDHRGSPASICRHEAPPGLTTRASIVLELGERALAVAYGPPCVTAYATYRMAPA